MGESTSTAIALFVILVVVVVFINIFQVTAVDSSLNKVDMFLAKKVSIYRGFTPQVELELMDLANRLNLRYESFDFSRTDTELQSWGATLTVSYSYENNIIQKGIEYLGLPRMTNRPREFDVVIMGR